MLFPVEEVLLPASFLHPVKSFRNEIKIIEDFMVLKMKN